LGPTSQSAPGYRELDRFPGRDAAEPVPLVHGESWIRLRHIQSEGNAMLLAVRQ
jgi:hypothetical protein